MSDGNRGGESDLPTGGFSSWIEGIRTAIEGSSSSDVPCEGCTACCTSSQFVHIGPDETDTLARIPVALLFPAPRLPRGHMLLGYDERGHCPMLIEDRCSIYEDRPRTCRTYDCRVFPAAGIDVDDGDGDKAMIARRARRWRFSYPTELDRIQQGAVRAAAAFLDEHRNLVTETLTPASATQRAVLAIRIHNVFLGRDEVTDQPTVIDPGPDVVRAAMVRLNEGADQT